jgi:hypothetical protein
VLYGITCSFLDRHFNVQKLVLGLPELKARHTGENIAAEVIEILSLYEIDDKIGYFTLDNASNSDTAMEAYCKPLPPPKRLSTTSPLCVDHIINLVVKAFIFGKGYQAFEDDLPSLDPEKDRIQAFRQIRKGHPIMPSTQLKINKC